MDVDDLRARINDLDRRMFDLLAERADLARQIGELKSAAGKAVFDPSREQVVLDTLAAEGAGLLPPAALRAILAEIISACRAVQGPLRVAYLGPAYTFSHLAAAHRFGSQAEYVDCGSVYEVFEAVEKEQVRVGVVPVENSLGGAITETLDSFLTSQVVIQGELYEPIHQCLLALDPSAPVKRLHTKPEPLAQARRWVRENLPGVEVVSQSSSAAAAQAASAEPGSAALAPAEAAEPYGLQIAAHNIEDYANNRTRFVVIGLGARSGSADDGPARTGRDKTSLVFATAHRAGALQEALTPLRIYGVSMTMIHSRPVPGRMWEYVFFVDVEGHQKDENVARAVEELGGLTSSLSILGSYPAAGWEPSDNAEA
jgi:chorismate mutase/prephenate dehydratase